MTRNRRRRVPSRPTAPPESSHRHHEHLRPHPESIYLDDIELVEIWRCTYRYDAYDRCEADAQARYEPLGEDGDAAMRGHPLRDEDITDVLEHDSGNRIVVQFHCPECERDLVIPFEFKEREHASV